MNTPNTPRFGRRLFALLMTALMLMMTALSAFAGRAEEVEAIRPQIDVIVDGERHSPSAMSAYDNTPLFYVVTEDMSKDGYMMAFTTERDARQFMAGLSADAGQDEFMLGIGKVKVYDYTGYDNLFTKYTRGDREHDLATATCFCDNDISSVKTNGKWLTLHTNTSYGGTWISMKGSHDNLSDYGWNNIASSLEVD